LAVLFDLVKGNGVEDWLYQSTIVAKHLDFVRPDEKNELILNDTIPIC